MRPVGIILDTARRSTGTRDTGCDVVVDVGYAARQITGHFTTRFRLESSRRLHVYLLHVSTLYLNIVYPSTLSDCLSICLYKLIQSVLTHLSHNNPNINV